MVEINNATMKFAVQKQAAVAAYFSSKQLLLFAIAGRYPHSPRGTKQNTHVYLESTYFLGIVPGRKTECLFVADTNTHKRSTRLQKWPCVGPERCRRWSNTGSVLL